jgi:uncharacterized protein (UPF0218 family)
MTDAQFRRDVRDVAGERPASDAGAPRGHLKIVQRRQCAGDVLGDTVAEIGLAPVVTAIDERQNRNRFQTVIARTAVQPAALGPGDRVRSAGRG